jgi:hypothetical protein
MEETNTSASSLRLQKDTEQKQGEYHFTAQVIGLAITMTIMLAVGVSDAVLLSISKCSFHIEIMPIVLTVYFVIGTTEKIFVYMQSARNKSQLTQKQCEPLIQNEDRVNKSAADGRTGGNTIHWVECYKRKRMSMTIILGLLDCFPVTLCALWIYYLCTYSDINDTHKGICKTRYWYSVAQATFFTTLSLSGMASAIWTAMRYLCPTCRQQTKIENYMIRD